MSTSRIQTAAAGFVVLVLQAGCAHEGVTLGFAPGGGPLVIQASSAGLTLQLEGRLATPLGTFSIAKDVVATAPRLPPIQLAVQRRWTYVEVLDRRHDKKAVFRLEGAHDKLDIVTKYRSHITIVNRPSVTVVTIDADEIASLVHTTPDLRAKPRFPETPIRYFALSHALVASVDWSVHGVADFLAVVLFGLLVALLFVLDLLVIAVLFLARSLWFFGNLIWYAGSSMGPRLIGTSH